MLQKAVLLLLQDGRVLSHKPIKHCVVHLMMGQGHQQGTDHLNMYKGFADKCHSADLVFGLVYSYLVDLENCANEKLVHM